MDLRDFTLEEFQNIPVGRRLEDGFIYREPTMLELFGEKKHFLYFLK